MKTTFREENGNFIVGLIGRLDTAASDKTAKELEVLNDCMGHNIIIDCEELDYISSSGLRIFLNIRKRAGAVGSKVIIKNVKEDIKKVLVMTGFNSIFNIEG